MNKKRKLLTTFFAMGIATSLAQAADTDSSTIATAADSTASVSADTSACNVATMDAFAYEDCIAAQKGIAVNEKDFGASAHPKGTSAAVATDNASSTANLYKPFGKDAYLTSSFGENRGTRYHAGLDFSTQMEEGWAILAPEDGKVKELRVSPFGYGKVMFFQGNSGKTWVFAHQSSFGSLDEAVQSQQYATKKNDVTLKPGKAYKKGDTLTFAGSTGIGNPHLHLEVRLDNDRVINPRLMNVGVSDTMAPQVFGAAVWQGNELAVTSASAIDKGCIVSPVKNEFSLNLAVKIADYSREPKDNPMSIRRVELWRYDEKIYSKVQDTLSFKKMLNIRDELLWAEEADTAGDWHFINAKIAPLSTYRLEIEDFAGNVTVKKFNFHPTCKDNAAIPETKVQTSPVYTFLSRSVLDLFRCESGHKFAALNATGDTLAGDLCKVFDHKPVLLGKIAETYPAIRSIQYMASADNSGNGKEVNEAIALYPYGKYQSSINWSAKIDSVSITQKISGIPVAGDTAIRVLAVTRTHTDSLDYFEFHPKGLQVKGNWNVCIDNKANPAPLYWLGETSRNWFIFSKQTKGKGRCASANELRDIASIDNQDAPTLGFPYWADAVIGGVRQPVLKVPLLFKYDGIENGNAITVKSGNKWIAAEYDSEPREIILEGEKLPEAGENITVQISDEGKHKVSYEITVPEM